MSGDKKVTPPPVMWAERRGFLLITFCLEDCKDPTINVEAEKIYFKGVGGTEHKEHEVTIDLFGEVDPDKTIKNAKGRLFEVVLFKKTEGSYWKRLTKEDRKYHWLRTDFNKWRAEDDSDGSGTDDGGHGKPDDLESMIRGIEHLSGDRKENFDHLPNEEEYDTDSDDGDLPDLE